MFGFTRDSFDLMLSSFTEALVDLLSEDEDPKDPKQSTPKDQAGEFNKREGGIPLKFAQITQNIFVFQGRQTNRRQQANRPASMGEAKLEGEEK